MIRLFAKKQPEQLRTRLAEVCTPKSWTWSYLFRAQLYSFALSETRNPTRVWYFCTDGPRCDRGETAAGRVHAAENGNPHCPEETGREGEAETSCCSTGLGGFRGSCSWVHMTYLSPLVLWGWRTSFCNRPFRRSRYLFKDNCSIKPWINEFVFVSRRGQLASEDETFLTENATATLSQFEKVTANLGENKHAISLIQSFILHSYSTHICIYIFYIIEQYLYLVFVNIISFSVAFLP